MTVEAIHVFNAYIFECLQRPGTGHLCTGKFSNVFARQKSLDNSKDIIAMSNTLIDAFSRRNFETRRLRLRLRLRLIPH